MDNQVILVSGGTKGIGRSICERFAAEDFVVITCGRSQDSLDAMESDFLKNNWPIYTFSADFSVREDIDRFLSFIKSLNLPIDVLVNNAGSFIHGNILDESEGTLDYLMRLNCYSAYYLTRAIAPDMVKRRKGHIINMSSVAGLQAYPGGASYCISKFALNGFSKVLREELKTTGVKVTTIHPGATWSDSWKGVNYPKERLMEATDIADSIFSATQLGISAVVEDIVIRPQLGDL